MAATTASAEPLQSPLQVGPPPLAETPAAMETPAATVQEPTLRGGIVKNHTEELKERCSSPEFSNADGDYILGPNDIFKISVMNLPELNKDSIQVQPDGKIILDILDEPLMVSGKTLTELYCELTAAYEKYVYDPHLTINMEQTKPYTVYITGSVLNPGSYEVLTQTYRNPPQTISEITISRISPLLSNVLVAAGGVKYNSDISHIAIDNKITGRHKEVDLLNLLKTGNTDQDILLVRGDSVHVPAMNTQLNEADYRLYASSSFSPHSIPIKVFGYVNRPGLIKLDTAQSLNLLSAITSAGGYVSNSAYSPNKVYVYRAMQEGGHLSRFEVNPKKDDVTVFPNDIVYVPLNKRARFGLFFDFIGRIVSPGARSAETYRAFTGDPLF